MSRTLEIEAVPELNPEGQLHVVRVRVASDEERDISVEHDGIDLIQKVASALGLSVSITTLKGDADDAPG